MGSGATLAPANLAQSVGLYTFAEYIPIINTPGLAPQPIRLSTADWSGASRCAGSSVQFNAPVPTSFLIPDSNGIHGTTPNHPSGIMTADGLNYIESQPLTHCPGQDYTTHYFTTQSVYGNGQDGSQGGSHMSGVGGTIRVGEWAAARTRGYINHAVKVVLDSANYSSAAGPGCAVVGCRWPATGSDCMSACGYTGSNADVKMGSLLTLAPAYNCAGLRTEPGRIFCATLKNYGAYIVDSGGSGGWTPTIIGVEFSPNGDAAAEFATQFGQPFESTSTWGLDVRDMMVAAQVVTNAVQATPKGGGTPLFPNPPALGN